MKTFTPTSHALLPAFLLLFLAGITSTIAFAQETDEKVVVEESIIKSSIHQEIKKTVDIRQVNGVKTITISTSEGGEKVVKVLTGEDAEKYMEDGFHSSIVIFEDTDLTFDDSEIATPASEKITIINTNSTDEASSTQSVWITEDDLEPMNVNVTKEVDGESTKVTFSYTDKNGKNVEKVMITDEEEASIPMQDIQELLEDLDIQLEIDVTENLEGDARVKTVIITENITIEEEDISEREVGDSPMFQDFTISPNPSNGHVKIDFTPVNKEKVTIRVLDLQGNTLFTDSYNGKGKYSKNISITNANGIIMVKVEQGNEVEIRKLIID